MAFINVGGNNVTSFAEYSDVTQADQRVFEANEGLADETMIEDLLTRATQRILTLIQQSNWWMTYYLRQSGQSIDPNIYTSGLISVPAPNPNRILARQSDFTDLCVYYAMSELILPKIADYGQPDSSEVKKIGVYDEKFRKRFQELINAGDWYDFNGLGSISSSEKMPVRSNLVRAR